MGWLWDVRERTEFLMTSRILDEAIQRKEMLLTERGRFWGNQVWGTGDQESSWDILSLINFLCLQGEVLQR